MRTQITFVADDEMIKDIDVHAKENRLSRAEQLRRIVEEWLIEKKKKDKKKPKMGYAPEPKEPEVEKIEETKVRKSIYDFTG